MTVQSGDTAVTVRPQTYCFDAAHCRISEQGNIGDITVSTGSTILVDVPRAVKGKGWQVRSVTQSRKDTFKTITDPGTSTSSITDSHSARLSVPSGVGTYFLVITQGSAAKPTGGWVTRVQVDG